MEEFKNINNAEETAVNAATTAEEISSNNTDDSLRILNNGTDEAAPDDYPECECDFDNFGDLSNDKTEDADDKPDDACDQCCSFCEGCENKSEPNDDSDEEPATEKYMIPKITFALGNDAYGNPEILFGENDELGPASRLGVSFKNADDANAAYEILSAFDKKLRNLNGDSSISLKLESKIINLLDLYLTQHVYFVCNNLHESDYEVKSQVMRNLADIIDAKIRSGNVIHNIRKFKLEPNMPAEALKNNPRYQTEIDTFWAFINAFTKRYEKRVSKLEKKVKKLKKKK